MDWNRNMFMLNFSVNNNKMQLLKTCIKIIGIRVSLREKLLHRFTNFSPSFVYLKIYPVRSINLSEYTCLPQNGCLFSSQPGSSWCQREFPNRHKLTESPYEHNTDWNRLSIPCWILHFPELTSWIPNARRSLTKNWGSIWYINCRFFYNI